MRILAISVIICFCLISPVSAFDILQPLPEIPITPSDNPTTKEKVELGKQLYFDTRLSQDNTLSCNSCHNLASGGDDDGGAAKLPGRKIHRSAPSIYNAAYQTVQFWDGRAKSVEEAIADHLFDADIMGNKSSRLVEDKFSKIPGYAKGFSGSFKESKPISIKNITKAISAFLRTLKTPNAPFDNYIRGNKKAISPSAIRGIERFNEIGCLSCHFGINLAGPAPGPAFGMGTGFYELFPNYLGSEYDEKYDLAKDVGRFLVTGEKIHLFMWRVPPLRNIALTAPYFHNGSVNTLEEAIRVMGKTQLGKTLNDQDVKDIKAFLLTLTGDMPDITLPRLPDTEGKHIELN
ncbi:MAG: c-type cytochrome [Gammaproteobacteria bacterium]|nr:c-type cytochrome [Gammaproteobacteria bacterium]MDH5694104.1 c-type cytochrome [Gammaproteobacteria bacterium]